jgi:putative endonuclease
LILSILVASLTDHAFQGTLKKRKASTGWTVYILRCADGSLYTGITRDITRRVGEHNSNGLAARYTRARRPVVLVYREAARTRSSACRREYRIKQMTRSDKLSLVASRKPQVQRRK